MKYDVLETAREIAKLSKEGYELFYSHADNPSRTKAIKHRIDEIVLRNHKADSATNFINNGILRLHLKYGEQPTPDEFIAVFKQREESKNQFGIPFEWFVVSYFFNHLLPKSVIL